MFGRGREIIPLPIIPLPNRAWQIPECSGSTAQLGSLVAALPRCVLWRLIQSAGPEPAVLILSSG